MVTNLRGKRVYWLVEQNKEDVLVYKSLKVDEGETNHHNIKRASFYLIGVIEKVLGNKEK